MSPLPTTVKLRGAGDADGLGEAEAEAEAEPLVLGGVVTGAVVAGAVVTGLPRPVADGEGAATPISGPQAASAQSPSRGRNARRDLTLREVTSAL
jgi:hypothetical protein